MLLGAAGGLFSLPQAQAPEPSCTLPLLPAAERNRLVAGFDAELAALGARRLGVAYDLKAGELRLLEALAELRLLQGTEAREQALAARQATQLEEAEEVGAKDAELAAALEKHAAAAAVAMGRREALAAAFEALVAPAPDAFRQPLTKIFMRCVSLVWEAGGWGGIKGRGVMYLLPALLCSSTPSNPLKLPQTPQQGQARAPARRRRHQHCQRRRRLLGRRQQ